MELKRFKGKNIHGYLNPNITFFEDINFLTGINGSGKTTVVNCIIALISPSLHTLTKIRFDFLSLKIENDGETFFINAETTDNSVTLYTSLSTEPLKIPVFQSSDPDSLVSDDEEAEFLDSFETSSSENETLSTIRHLPTPLFLNLERRTTTRTPRRVSRRQYLRSESVFAQNLGISLRQATSLADNAYKEVLIQQRELGEELRRQIALDAFTVKPSPANVFRFNKPSAEDIKSIGEMKNEIPFIAQLLNVDEEEVSSRLGSYLTNLEISANKIPRNRRMEEILRDRNSSAYIMEWVSNRPHLDRIRFLIDRVKEHRQNTVKIAGRAENYMSLVNRFLLDSGKKSYSMNTER